MKISIKYYKKHAYIILFDYKIISICQKSSNVSRNNVNRIFDEIPL